MKTGNVTTGTSTPQSLRVLAGALSEDASFLDTALNSGFRFEKQTNVGNNSVVRTRHHSHRGQGVLRRLLIAPSLRFVAVLMSIRLPALGHATRQTRPHPTAWS